jgi:hypothetical protein
LYFSKDSNPDLHYLSPDSKSGMLTNYTREA